ncbi:NADPH-dependent FMN reductase [Pseudomonas chlororaphis]|uniref:NADPH-dependent FMN reductase n=1 Tax=Pseudomonas chlororaphis TaxID=587753 RepID=A0A1Q8ERX6_9PSED|nr:NAD(P)H-dependent oxidoreductase [Pseudomonas chlororaphis]OLF54539.1 NADPH-dependent FMN reductase [Pseudomonas chlororaphis]
MSLQIALIAGSSQHDSQSARIARYLGERLLALQLCARTSVLDLGRSPLPLWPSPEADSAWSHYSATLREADALVVVAPEWNGMACPAIKNFFVYAGHAELGHKPALLVGVSAGVGGAYPLAELRASSYKNCRICYLPEQLIVRQVEQAFHPHPEPTAAQRSLHARADWSLGILAEYASAMQPLRTRIDLQAAPFVNGM